MRWTIASTWTSHLLYEYEYANMRKQGISTWQFVTTGYDRSDWPRLPVHAIFTHVNHSAWHHDWLECSSQRKHYDTPYIPKGEKNNKYKGVPHQRKVLIRYPCSSCLMFFFWTIEPASRAWRPRQPMGVSVEKGLASAFSPPCGRLPHVITAPSHRSAAKAASELLEVAIHLWKKCRVCQIGNFSTNQIQVKSETIFL